MLAALLLAAAALAAGQNAPAGAVGVRATAVPLSAEPSRTTVGALSYRGGLVLASDDRRFGGFSGLHVTADGTGLLAVTDEGNWLSARLTYDAQGFLAGMAGAEMGPLLGLDALPLSRKRDADAESLTVMPDGAVIVGFEHNHRLWVYRGPDPFASRPQTFTPPPGVEAAPPNGGLESLAALPDGGLFALSEDMMDEGLLRAWWWHAGGWRDLRYRPAGQPHPSDATALPSGDVLVLERSYSPLTGLRMKLRLLARDCLKGPHPLDPPVIADLDQSLTVDNFEGVAARRGKGGETLVYLFSDDNFNAPLQKTLLMMFALDPKLAEPGKGCGE